MCVVLNPSLGSIHPAKAGPFARTRGTLLLLTTVLVLGGCGRPTGGHAHGPEGAESEHSGGGHHVHTAPHGGVLAELGDHEGNLEFLRDPQSGKLTLWVLDAHAEGFVRVPLPSLRIEARSGNLLFAAEAAAVANPATGETVGDTSQFEVTLPEFRGAGPFTIRVPDLNLPAQRYRDIQVELP